MKTGEPKLETIASRFCVAGGGLAGLLAALAAARRGIDTVLVTDRPVLGGNASKEIRVWISGACGGANNRWFRETGLLDELLIENMRRNPEGNAEVWDAVLMDAVLAEKRLRVFYNTSICAVHRAGSRIGWVEGIQSGTERRLKFTADYYADCTGDGTVGALAGSAFMRGCEARSKFGESLAPARAESRTMGDSILFAVKDAGHPVPFTRPGWAHRFTKKTFRWRWLPSPEGGCNLWWVEYGGLRDTIRENEEIRFELLRIVMGLWDFIKKSGEYRGKSENLELEWVGTVPGKRESRRLVGDKVLTQRDVEVRPDFPDAVAYGGWSIDDHPARGLYDRKSPSSHYYLRGMYNIPFRCLYSNRIRNLLMAGRNASVSHIALCTTRVMATCAQMGEAVGAAVALALRQRTTPRAIARGPLADKLQQDLLRADHYIVGVRNTDRADFARQAAVTASSSLAAQLVRRTGWRKMEKDMALMFPVAGTAVGSVTLALRARKPTVLSCAFHGGDAKGDFLPGKLLRVGKIAVPRGAVRRVDIPLGNVSRPGFHWLILGRNSALEIGVTKERLPGVQGYMRGPQKGTDYNWRNDFSPWGWTNGEIPVFTQSPRQEAYAPDSVMNGFARPFIRPNLWISGGRVPQWLRLAWETPRRIRLVQLKFDTDLDREYAHLWTPTEFRAWPTCVRDYRLVAETSRGRKVLVNVRGNYQRLREHKVNVRAHALRLEVLATNGDPHARVYEIRAY